MICYWCNQPRPIVFSEYFKERHARLNLCWGCLGELGFLKTQATLLPKIKVCPKCQNKFLPKQSWAGICTGCWKFKKMGGKNEIFRSS
jgi:protein-arginine kinase activator protein McsA